MQHWPWMELFQRLKVQCATDLVIREAHICEGDGLLAGASKSRLLLD